MSRNLGRRCCSVKIRTRSEFMITFVTSVLYYFYVSFFFSLSFKLERLQTDDIIRLMCDTCLIFVLPEINNKKLVFSFSLFREVEACSLVLAAMITFFNHLLMLHSGSNNGNLFPVQEHLLEDVLERARTINQFAFYGRCLGFHYAESIKPIMKFIAITMASFSESYYSNNGTFIKATNSMFTSGKYLLDPELRSRRIVGLSQNSSVDFCKVKYSRHSRFFGSKVFTNFFHFFSIVILVFN